MEVFASYHTPMASFLNPEGSLYLVVSWNISVYLWLMWDTDWFVHWSTESMMSLNAPRISLFNLISYSFVIEISLAPPDSELAMASLICCSKRIFSFLSSLM
jgi:hypothetical protein